MYLTQGEEAAFCLKEVALLLLLHPTSLMSSSSHSSTTNPLLANDPVSPSKSLFFQARLFPRYQLAPFPLSPGLSWRLYLSHCPQQNFQAREINVGPPCLQATEDSRTKATAQVNRLQTSNLEVAKHQEVRLTAVFTSLSLGPIWSVDCSGVCWRKQKS